MNLLVGLVELGPLLISPSFKTILPSRLGRYCVGCMWLLIFFFQLDFWLGGLRGTLEAIHKRYEVGERCVVVFKGFSLKDVHVVGGLRGMAFNGFPYVETCGRRWMKQCNLNCLSGQHDF